MEGQKGYREKVQIYKRERGFIEIINYGQSNFR